MELIKKTRKNSCLHYFWIPLKAHYFFMFGAVAGVSPFLTVIGKDLGLNAAAVGITYTILPIWLLFVKPCFGFISDYLQNTKTIIVCLLTTTVALYMCLPYMKAIEDDKCPCMETQLRCAKNNGGYKKFLFDFNTSCINNLLPVSTVRCNISYQHLPNHDNVHQNWRTVEVETRFESSGNNIHQHLESNRFSKNLTDLIYFILLNNSTSEETNICDTLSSPTNTSFQCDHEIESCIVPKNAVKFYSTYQFWCFTFITVFALSFKFTAMSLTDISCYELLGEQSEYFGRQRLWGTASTGIVTLLSGYLNDLISKNEGNNEYLSGFYIMVFLYIIDMIILFNINLPKSNLSRSIISDVSGLCRSSEFRIYATAVFLVGCFTSLNANYLFWYLRDLGAKQTLLGSAIAVQCLLAEVPFFFFSGWVIKHLGYFNCLTCTFISFALRFGLYSLLQNPWFVLPIEVLHGVTYAVFYASKASFVSKYAPPGTEATIFGILGGICDGLGCAVGSLLGGLGFNHIGGSRTFLIACGLNIICIPAVFFSQFAFRKTLYKKVNSEET